MVRGWLVSIALVGALGVAAQPALPDTRAVQQAILNLDPAATDRALAALSDPTLVTLYRHHAAFVRALAQQEAQALAQFEAYSETQLRALGTPTTALAWAATAELQAERGVVLLLTGSRLSAFWAFTRAHGALQHLAHEHPTAGLHQRLQGLFALTLSTLPSSYQWMARQLGLVTDGASGQALLAQAAGDPLFAEQLPLYRYFVARHLDNDLQAALGHLEQARTRLPHSPLVSYLYAAHQLQLKAGAAALAYLRPMLADPAQAARQIPFTWYMLGKAELFAGNTQAARRAFERFLQLQQGSLLRRDARFRLGVLSAWAHPATASAAFEAVWDEPLSPFDDDQAAGTQALALAETGYHPVDLALYRARYASDGGYTEAAHQVLDSLNQAHRLADHQVTELAYRRARLYHHQGQVDRARLHYLHATLRTPVHGAWMVPYSRYYLGTLAEAEGKLRTALDYYEQALAHTGYEYAQGLEQKAKAGRARVRKALRLGD